MMPDINPLDYPKIDPTALRDYPLTREQAMELKDKYDAECRERVRAILDEAVAPYEKPQKWHEEMERHRRRGFARSAWMPLCAMWVREGTIPVKYTVGDMEHSLFSASGTIGPVKFWMTPRVPDKNKGNEYFLRVGMLIPKRYRLLWNWQKTHRWPVCRMKYTTTKFKQARAFYGSLGPFHFAAFLLYPKKTELSPDLLLKFCIARPEPKTKNYKQRSVKLMRDGTNDVELGDD